MEDNNKFRIIIAEDHQIFRNGMRTSIEMTGFATLVGEAKDGTKLLELLEYTTCDIVIMDIRMPFLDGAEASKIILKKYPRIKIMVMTAVEDEDIMHELLSLGVLSYVLKDIEQEELEFALKEVLNNKIYLSKQFQTIVYHYYINTKGKNMLFTNTEIEILAMVVKGMVNKNIADKLFKSVRTIEGHLYRMMKKTSTKNINQLINFAIKNHLI